MPKITANITLLGKLHHAHEAANLSCQFSLRSRLCWMLPKLCEIPPIVRYRLPKLIIKLLSQGFR